MRRVGKEELAFVSIISSFESQNKQKLKIKKMKETKTFLNIFQGNMKKIPEIRKNR